LSTPGFERRKTQKIPIMSKNAARVPRRGDTTMAARILPSPSHLRTPAPRAAAADPTIPPMMAWEEEEGIP